ncbi:pentatricopeptide repeat-containing protein [Senna tora]|uniref:Pentatricopeptide repeat-containing protein n=1 Tax=Senna tora TaxID=362788 RepID=A0A834W6K4_9FABA|nr:pentatricopeptide repeat-containing protein [Senna tora]
MGMTSSDLSRLSPNIITLSRASPFKKGGLGESPRNGHPTKRTPQEWITLRRDNIYRRNGPLPSNGSLSPRPRPTVARLAPQYPSSHKGWRIGGVTGEWSSDKANTSRKENPSKGQHITKGRAVAIKWQPITATTANNREASLSVPIIPQRMDHFDSAYAREILPRKKVDPWVIDFGWTATHDDPSRRPAKIWPRASRIALKLLGRDHFDSAYAREILPRKKVDPWVIDFGWTATDGYPSHRPSKIWPRASRITLKLLGRDHFDSAYAREILPRKVSDPWVIDFGWTATDGDPSGRPSKIWPRASRIALKLLGDHFDSAYAREILPRKKVDPWVIDFGWTAIHVVDHRATDSDGLETSWEASLCHRLHFDPSHARFIFTRHMHVGFGRDHDALIYALHRPYGMSSLTGRDLTWDADIFCAIICIPLTPPLATRIIPSFAHAAHVDDWYALTYSTGVFTLSKLNDRVTCGTCAPLTRNLGSARATAETYRDVALGAKLVTYNRVPVCPLRCARFASGREKTCPSDRSDTWDLEEGRIEATRAESQWIVAARPLCHLQYPVAYLSRLQRILPAARWEFVQGVPCGSSAARGSPTTRAFGGRGPYCWSANGRRANASLLARILT